MKGDFFAIGLDEWKQACELGLNPACALLVLARGTGRDNVTTKWSATALEKYAGITWRRGTESIEHLKNAGIVSLRKAGKRPQYALHKPDDDANLIWLPNALVTGAAGEVPPVMRLRANRQLDELRLLVELYHEHELTGDGGLPRNIMRARFKREQICERGQFDVYGFAFETDTAYADGPLKRYWATKENPVWDRLKVLINTGLLERVDYLVEADDPDAELIHALSGDAYAESAEGALQLFKESLPGCYSYSCDSYNYVLPIPRNSKQTVVGVYRLRYRPHTSRTAAWYARHAEACKAAESLYMRLAEGDYRQRNAA